MKVLQIIDSLNPGGAEKMAVNIANALLPHIKGSYFCCTRQEGMLKDQLKPEVGYVFLNKRSSLDLKALLKLKIYIKENKIDIVHAHSTSYFLAGLLKLSGCRFKLIWHDHYGESEFLEKRDSKILRRFSGLFSGIISVNSELKGWAYKNLQCENVTELKNFIPDQKDSFKTGQKLKGGQADYKIICIANLRPQKDHLNLLKAFELLDPKLAVSLHLIGENPKTDYSASVLKLIENSKVSHKIYYYGAQSEITPFLKQADLGVLSSRSEGLPLALIEYGMVGLPIVCTSVGQCSALIGENGIIVPAGNPSEFRNGILYYFHNTADAKNAGFLIQRYMEENYLGKRRIIDFISFYNSCNFDNN